MSVGRALNAKTKDGVKLTVCAASAILREDVQEVQSAALWSACLEAQQAFAAGTMLRAQQHNTEPTVKTPAKAKTSVVLNVLRINSLPSNQLYHPWH